MAFANSEVKPEKAITVFAGADIDATDTAREYFTGYAPSSPSIGFLKNGKLVKMFERRDLEGRPPFVIAESLVEAFRETSGNAEAVTAFALEKNLQLIAIWSLDRDQPCEFEQKIATSKCSSVEQDPLAFSLAFNALTTANGTD